MARGEATVAALMAAQHGVVSRDQASRAGMARSTFHRRQVGGLVEPVQPGVWRTAGHPETWEGRVLAACLSVRGLASHRTAAVLWGLTSVRGQMVEVTVAKSSARRRRGVVLHESTQMQLCQPHELRGIPLTGVARTLLDLASVVPSTALEDAVDDALRLRLVTWPGLLEVLISHSARGRPGCRALRQLIDQRHDDGGEIPLSGWSRQMARLLVDHGLPAPALEHQVLDGRGRLVAQVDLAYPDHRVAIELQSRRWHLNRRSFEQDPARWNRLTALGWRVFPITWEPFLRQPADQARLISQALALTPTRPPHS